MNASSLRFTSIMLVVAAAGANVGCGGAAADASPAETVAVTHESGSMTLSADPENDQYLILSLPRAGGAGLRVRSGGQSAQALHMVDLIRFWNEAANPARLANQRTTATIAGTNAQGVRVEAIVEITHPQWDSATRTPTYRVRPAAAAEAQATTPLPALGEALQSASVTFAVTQASLPVALPPVAVGQGGGLQVYTTTLCHHVASTEGEHHSHFLSASSHPNFMQVCRPSTPDGYYFVSDAAVATQFGWNPVVIPVFSVVVVKADDTPDGATALARPVGATEVWRDKGSGGDQDFTIYQPLPPPGYVCLGIFVQPNYERPEVPDNYRCVRQDLTAPPAGSPGFIWTDSGSGADQDVVLASPPPVVSRSALNFSTYGITFAAPPGAYGMAYPACSSADQYREPACTVPATLKLLGK